MISTADLRKFYSSNYGKLISKEVKVILGALASLHKDKRSLIVGFGIPYFTEIFKEHLLMFAHVGIYPWPDQKNNIAILSHENEWPILEQEFDEIIIIHGLEYAYNPAEVMAECYRCLKAEGKLLIITPNRRSIWAHNDKTPLGCGQPYTLTQLEKMLHRENFIVTSVKRSLYQLPFNGVYGKIISFIFEKLAKRILQKFSGLVGVLAIKQIYSGERIKRNVKLVKSITPQQSYFKS